jgi:hypothetical protein
MSRTSTKPAAPPVTHHHVAALNASLAELARRVDRIAGEIRMLHAPPRDAVGELPVTDADEPVNRASVPPLLPSKLSDHVFDVLLGTAAADEEDAVRRR